MPREDPAVGQPEVEHGEDAYRAGVGDSGRHVQPLEERDRDRDVAGERHDPGARVEARQAPEDARAATPRSIAPRPALVPHEVVKHRGLHGNGGCRSRREARTSREEPQHGHLHPKAHQADAGE